MEKIGGNMKKLTFSEQKVLELIIKGYSNPKIADKLSVTESTIKAHVSNILRKTELSNRVELVVFAITNDLVKI